MIRIRDDDAADIVEKTEFLYGRGQGLWLALVAVSVIYLLARMFA